MRVVALDESRTLWAQSIIAEHFGSTRVVSRGRLHDVVELPGILAVDGERALGVAYYRLEEDSCEIVAIVACEPGRGVGRALVAALGDYSSSHGCGRLWLVTTNDNVSAQRFYSALGFTVVAVHEGAVNAARAIKPEIPEAGEGGVPIEDEIEFELRLPLS